MDQADFSRWRKTLGYTRVEAGELLGFTRLTIRNWERGFTRVPMFVGLACHELLRQWKQRPEFGPVALVYFEKPIWPNPQEGTSALCIQCEVCANNEIAIRQTLRLSVNGHVSNPFIIEPDGCIVWNAPELMSECERRKQKVIVKQKKSEPLKGDRPRRLRRSKQAAEA